MKIVYIAHPVSNDVAGNLERVRKIVRFINVNTIHVVPVAPYWLDCHALDDTVQDERNRGMLNGYEILRRRFIDEVWVYGNILSNGVAAEVALCRQLGIPVIYKSIALWQKIV